MFSTLLFGVFCFVILASLSFTRGAFFHWDEWSLLSSLSLVGTPTWLLQTHLGHFQPLGRLFYRLQIELFSDYYPGYILTSVAIHSVNMLLLVRIFKRLQVSAPISFVAAASYGLYYAHIRNIIFSMQSMLFIYLLLFLIALDLLLLYWQSGRRTKLIMSGFASALSSLSFGTGLVSAPILFIVTLGLYFLSVKKHKNASLRSALSVYLLAGFFTAAIYLTGESFSDQTGNHPGARAELLSLAQLREIITLKSFQGFLALGTFTVPVVFLGLSSVPKDYYIFSTILFWLVSFNLFWVYLRSPKRALIACLLFLAINLLLTVLAALTRFPFGPEAAFRPRYQTYTILPTVFMLALGINAILGRLRKTRGRFDNWSSLQFFTLGLLALAVVTHTVFSVVEFGELKRERLEKVHPVYQYYLATPDQSNRDGSEIFLKEANPQLTVEQFMRIRNTLFDN